MSEKLSIKNIRGGIPQWMFNPEFREVALSLLPESGKKPSYKAIARELARKRVSVNPDDISNLARNNKGSEQDAVAFLRDLFSLPQSEFMKLSEKKKNKPRGPRGASSDAATRGLSADISREKKNNYMLNMLNKYGQRHANDPKVRELAEIILADAASGLPFLGHGASISFLKMLVHREEEGGTKTFMGNGVNIDVHVSVSSSKTQPAVSEEGKFAMALVWRLKKILDDETGEEGAQTLRTFREGEKDRIELCIVAQGGRVLVKQKIVPAKAA